MASAKNKRESNIPDLADCNQEKLYDFIFKKVKFGVCILDFNKNKLLYKNQHFNTIARGQEKQIIREISGLIKKEEFLCGEQREIVLSINSHNFDIGISGYTITDREFLIFLKDISTKKISQERKSLNKFYLDFSRALGAISHEVGNPLASIGTSLQIILTNLEEWESAKIKKYLSKTVTEIKRVSEFLKNIRNFTWEENIEIQKINLKDIIEKVLDRNELFISSHNVSITTHIDPKVNVLIDENAFIQVLLNLINNSVNILKENKKGKISISTEDYNESFIKLIYKNNGKPIEKENLDKIFTLFFSTNEKGRGMGLSISMKLMTSMGGTIKAVEPDDGIGAEFDLFLPLKRKANNSQLVEK